MEQLDVNVKLCGFYKLEAVKLDKNGNEISRRLLADWFPNLITDGGLNRYGHYSDYLSYCQVGSSSSAPAFTDNALGSRIANNSSASRTSGYLTTSPYYGWQRTVFRFNEGVATGNLSEVGVGWATTGSLFSKALILDGLGDPTTITVLADETLDVTYEFRYYPKLTDDTGSVVFTGNIGGSYDFIARTAGTNVGYWTLGTPNPMYSALFMGTYAGDGAIGAITGIPTGTAITNGTVSAQSYVDSSLERKFNVSFGLTQGNHASGLKCVLLGFGIGAHQFQFTPAIPKTSNDILTFVVKHSWGRV